MRCYTKPHKLSCGIDLHARTMYVCLLSQHGAGMVHQNCTASPATCLKVIAPYRDDVVGAVEGICTWDWLAALCTRAQIPFVLGPALYMPALQGGKATNDRLDAQTIAVRLRGGMPSKARARCLATTPHCAVPWSCPSSQRPNSTAPPRARCSARSLGSARV